MCPPDAQVPPASASTPPSLPAAAPQQPSQAPAMAPELKVTLTTVELQVLSELDSTNFGFLRLNEDQHSRKKELVVKAIRYLERFIVQSREKERKAASEDKNNNGKTKSNSSKFEVDPKLYCKIGHLHLLLEDYSKSLSAYQKYFGLCKEYWKDPAFLYGLGLVYFHFNSFVWAKRAFQQVLYADSGFSRANEVHIRLGLIAKIENEFDTSLKHFKMAQVDVSPCSFSELEMRFHLAHLHEVTGDSAHAKAAYEQLLNDSQNLPQSLRADIYRQLGWMYHSVESLGEKSQRMQLAIQHLQKSIECDPKSVQSLYLLGRCYASIGKVHEAFIAYRNSVDKSESNADTWCSIGVLYQQQNQPMDALQAYICAVQLDKDHSAAWTNLGILYESSNQPQDSLACYSNASRKRLPPPNLSQRIKYLKSQLASMPPPPVPPTPGTPQIKKPLPSVEEAWNLPISNEMPNRQLNGRPKDAKPQHAQPQQQQPPKPPFYLTPSQLQTLQYLQNQPNLLPQQQQLLHQLQSQFRYMQQHQQAQRQQQQQQQQAALQQQQAQQREPVDLLNELQNKDLGSVSDKELEALITQQDIGSFAESLLKEMQADGGDASDVDDNKIEDSKDGIKQEPGEDVKVSSLDIPTQVETVKHCRPKTLRVNSNMRARDIVQCCETIVQNGARFPMSTSLLPDSDPPPLSQDSVGVKPSKEQLLPPTPSVYLDNKKDAFSTKLQDFCQQNPITVVRGIAGALKLDLGLFSTKTLQEEFSSHKVEVRTQVKQNPDENIDPATMRPVWTCNSTKSNSTLGKFAQYQIGTFQESLKDELEKPGSAAEKEAAKARRLRALANRNGLIKFASNVEMSDARKFRQQHTELMKLPVWLRVVSASNMLSHLGAPILGMNTVRLQMKVPGSRFAAFQERSGFCSININIGPGDCEWFGVPEEYGGALKKLCDKHGVYYYNGSWWPNMKDLTDDEIPVYRFLQKPGDLVWVNTGCVHWVQADGWCNNITWNVGPLTHTQYKLSLERYECSKMQHRRPTIPMASLSWNIARNIRLTDTKLFDIIRYALMQSLKQVALTIECVKTKGLEMQRHGRYRNEPSKFCGLCECEVFAMLFIREEESKPVIHCLNCAMRKMPDLKGFVCLEETRLKELMDIYDNFKLHTPTVPSPVVPPVSQQSHHHSSQGSASSSSTPSKSASSSSTAAAAASAAASYAVREKLNTAKAAAALASAMSSGAMTPSEMAAAAAMFSSFGASRMDLG